MKTCLVTLLAVLTTFAPNRLSASQNLVYNGSFEINGFDGWTLSSGGLVTENDPSVQKADGTVAVGLAALSTLYQDVPTVAGQQYDFYFYMADWGPDSVPQNVVYLSPSFGSTSLGTVSFSGVGKTYQNMGWEKFDYTVTADSATTRLTFYNPSGARWPLIDYVWVTPIPEPSVSALLLLGGTVVLSSCRRTNRLEPRDDASVACQEPVARGR